jgi:phospholipid-translocating ATPase
MATDNVSVDRGFDFATEEHGVEMRRVQTNLSERRIRMSSIRKLPIKGKSEISGGLLKGFMKRRV